MRFDPSDVQHEREQCVREIEECKRLLRSGHPDVEGLCLALRDWSTELRILDGRERARSKTEQHSDNGGQRIEAPTPGE